MTIRIDGHPISLLGGSELELPGLPRWRRYTKAYPGDLVAVGWVDTEHEHGYPICLSLYNVSGTVARDVDLGGMTWRMSPRSGLGWIDPAWVEVETNGLPTTPMDGRWLAALPADGNPFGLGGRTDPDPTKTTGSNNVELQDDRLVMRLVHGASRAMLLKLNQYWLEQQRRPRQWRNKAGVPEGFVPLSSVKRNGGRITSPKLAGFAEWDGWQNFDAGNAYDLQHLDASELYAGWKITGWPWFLDALINLYTHARSNGWYIQRTPKQDYASNRTFGYWMRIGAFMFDALSGLGPEWEWLRADVLDELNWHLTNYENNAPWPMVYGSVPPEYQKATYFYPWQWAVMVRGLQDVRDLMPSLANRAEAAADALLEVIESKYDPTTRTMVYLEKADGSDPHRGVLNGTSLWHLPALLNASPERRENSALLGDLLVAVAYMNDPKHYLYPTWLKLAGKWLEWA